KILEIEEGQKYLQPLEKPKQSSQPETKQDESEIQKSPAQESPTQPIQESPTKKSQSTSEEENSDDEYIEDKPGIFFTDFWINPEETIDVPETNELDWIRELLKLTRPPSASIEEDSNQIKEK